MGHQITPDQDNANVDLGRFLHENSYNREKKEISWGNLKFDIVRMKDGELIIGEVKKSSRFKESARMQLAFYLKRLKEAGISASGELRFPDEKRKETLNLNSELEEKLNTVEKDILRIIYSDLPPAPQKCNWCKKCAYADFCWS